MLYFVLCISGSLPSQLLYFVFFNQPSQAKGICPLNPLLHISICSTPTSTRRAAFKHKGFTRGLPIDVALNVSLQMPSFPFHIGRNPPIQTTASILVVCKM